LAKRLHLNDNDKERDGMTFSRIRGVILIVCFISLTFGLYLYGTKITAFLVPVLNCPFNHELLVDGSCYDICHLKDYLSSNWVPGKIGIAITFFATNLLIMLILGRVLCGFICPFGLIQDALDKVRRWLRIDSLRLNETHYQWIHLVKWVMLVIFLTINFVGVSFCYFCPVLGITPALSGRIMNITISGLVAIMVVSLSFLKKRFWCNICPLGLLIGLLHRVSLFRLRKNCQACTECGACYEACPMGIKSIYTERVKTDITTHDCIMCGECVDKCPENNALSLGILKFKFYNASRQNFFSGQGIKPHSRAYEKIEKLL
jgi:ferredoxin-type protein NapH